MRKFLLAATVFSVAPFVAKADLIVEDPLHGFCNNVACADVNSGGNTVTSNTGTGFDGTHWGFTISPGPQTGDFDVVLAIPNNQALGSTTVSGTINGVAASNTVTARGAWTSGFLDAQAQISALFPNASPTNPLANFIGFTQSVDPGAVSYNLYSVSFGSRTVQANPQAGPGAMDLSANVPTGSMIFGFFDSPDSGWIATASSGVLWADGHNPDPVPEPATIALLGVGLLGLAAIRRRAN